MMTTLTTLLGMLPLAIGDAQVGGGGEGPAYYPLARAIIGGLSFSAIVSLIIVPVFYVWFDDLNLWRKHVFTRVRPAIDAPPTGSPQVEPGT
jgi:HAE1 family hydrophobic/amphiphilic exporter-1